MLALWEVRLSKSLRRYPFFSNFYRIALYMLRLLIHERYTQRTRFCELISVCCRLIMHIRLYAVSWGPNNPPHWRIPYIIIKYSRGKSKGRLWNNRFKKILKRANRLILILLYFKFSLHNKYRIKIEKIYTKNDQVFLLAFCFRNMNWDNNKYTQYFMLDLGSLMPHIRLQSFDYRSYVNIKIS